MQIHLNSKLNGTHIGGTGMPFNSRNLIGFNYLTENLNTYQNIILQDAVEDWYVS